jgi:sugar phosphate isomerase/epimerase
VRALREEHHNVGLNLLPRRGPVVGVTLDAAPGMTLEARLDWAARLGFAGVELNATGELSGFHAPELAPEQRETLRGLLTPFTEIAVQAPHQATFDVTLVSPSAAVRRASLSEIWSVCRFAKNVGASVVTIRTGTPPVGVGDARRDVFLSECLTTLDRTAVEQGVHIGVLNRDRFRHITTLDDLLQLSLSATGIAFDAAHALDLGVAPEDLAAFAAARQERLVYVRVPLTPELPELAAALSAGGYSGLVTLTPTADAATREADLTLARERWTAALDGRAGDETGGGDT